MLDRITPLYHLYSNFSDPQILIVGKKTVLGAALKEKLSNECKSIISVEGINEIDFASQDTLTLFERIHITEAYITYIPPIIRHTSSDGSDYIKNLQKKYVEGLTKFLKTKNINFIFATSQPLYSDVMQTVISNGGSFIEMPYLIDSTAVHDLENPTMRSVRECLKVGYSHIEYSPYSTYQSISSSEAADFIIQQLHKQTTEHILVKGYSNTTIEASIQNVLNTLHLSQCKIHFRNYSHKIDKLPQPNKIEHIGSPNSDVHQMLTEAYKDFSYKENPIPYMSIVVTGRHDNFSGGYMMRSQNTLTSIDYALSQVPLANIEVVFVDYATAETTTLLSEEFVIGPNLRNKVRFIIVPPKSHEKLCEKLNKKIAFFEYIAKNIGTRRSFGKFVLTANTDDLFSTELFELIAARQFNEAIMYRALRWDQRDTTLKNDGITMMELIGNVTEIWKLRKMDINQRCGHGSYRFAIVDSSDAFSKKSYPCATGDFLLLSKDLWDAVQGFNELPANPGVDTVFQARMMKFAPGFARMFVYPLIIHQRHPRQNMFRPSVANSEEVLNEYTCKGTCKLCSPYYDSDDWGLKNENFSVIIR